jgi:hypothetical protein
MKAIWTQDDASYAAGYVRSTDLVLARADPEAAAAGVGGRERAGRADRVLAFGDAWFPGHDVARGVVRVERLSTRLLA